LTAACARELATRGYSLALMSRSDEATDLATELGGVGLVGSVLAVARSAPLGRHRPERRGNLAQVVLCFGTSTLLFNLSQESAYPPRHLGE